MVGGLRGGLAAAFTVVTGRGYTGLWRAAQHLPSSAGSLISVLPVMTTPDEGTGEETLQGWDEEGAEAFRPSLMRFCLEPRPQEKLTFEPFSAAGIPDESVSLNRLNLSESALRGKNPLSRCVCLSPVRKP